jgi:hypothetical protein
MRYVAKNNFFIFFFILFTILVINSPIIGRTYFAEHAVVYCYNNYDNKSETVNYYTVPDNASNKTHLSKTMSFQEKVKQLKKSKNK